MNNFIEQIQKAKEDNNAVAFFAYKARHCNQMALNRDGGTKEAFLQRRDVYMAAARKAALA